MHDFIHPSIHRSPLTAHSSFSQKHLASSFLLIKKEEKTSKTKTFGLFLLLHQLLVECLRVFQFECACNAKVWPRVLVSFSAKPQSLLLPGHRTAYNNADQGRHSLGLESCRCPCQKKNRGLCVLLCSPTLHCRLNRRCCSQREPRQSQGKWYHGRHSSENNHKQQRQQKATIAIHTLSS